ncbi:MAG: oligosaccharide flippase family protein [Eggerthella lenta]
MAETEDGKKDVKKLAKNTGFLYLLSLSSQIVNLALIPFETRVLGSEAYGVIALSVAMSSIITIVLDFGLILSATERVVKLAGNAASLARLLGNVACAKACLALAVGMVIVVLILFVPPFSEYRSLFLLLPRHAVNAFLPDFSTGPRGEVDYHRAYGDGEGDFSVYFLLVAARLTCG